MILCGRSYYQLLLWERELEPISWKNFLGKREEKHRQQINPKTEGYQVELTLIYRSLSLLFPRNRYPSPLGWTCYQCIIFHLSSGNSFTILAPNSGFHDCGWSFSKKQVKNCSLFRRVPSSTLDRRELKRIGADNVHYSSTSRRSPEQKNGSLWQYRSFEKKWLEINGRDLREGRTIHINDGKKSYVHDHMFMLSLYFLQDRARFQVWAYGKASSE